MVNEMNCGWRGESRKIWDGWVFASQLMVLFDLNRTTWDEAREAGKSVPASCWKYGWKMFTVPKLLFEEEIGMEIDVLGLQNSFFRCVHNFNAQ